MAVHLLPAMTRIPLSKIDLKNRRYELSYGRDNEKLRSSIKAVGIVEPVILAEYRRFARIPLPDGNYRYVLLHYPRPMKEPKPYVPVAGMRRLDCARSLRMRSVPAIVIDDIPQTEALLMAVHTNMERGYNIIEKANVLRKMLGFGFPRQDVLAFMRYLDLDPGEKILDTFLALGELEPLYKDFVFKANMSLRNTGSFLRFDAGERKRIVRSLAGLHLTESTVREIFEMLHILKIRKGRLTAGDIPALPNAEALRALLKERTHPILTSLTRKLKAIRDSMALPQGVDIRVDPFFEKEYIDLALRIKDDEDVRTALAKISGLAEAGYLRSILELTKGTIR